MASDSHSHATSSGVRPKNNKVTAHHTLERVRNNQRRHRTRRRDYITTLEQKLSSAEQSVMTLRDQVDALQAELAQCRNLDGQIVSSYTQLPWQLQNDDGGRSPEPIPSPGETHFQELGLPPEVVELGVLTLSTSMFSLSDDLPGGISPEFVDVISSHAGPEDADGPAESEIPLALVPLTQPVGYCAGTPLAGFDGGCHSGFCSATDLALQTTDYQPIGTLLSATATLDPIFTTTGTCCSDRHSLKPDDDSTDKPAVIMSRGSPPLLPDYDFQPAMKAYYKYSIEGESTMLCAEAYLLIAQQNFKGVSQKDVATWLWNGFRKSLSPGEGCRVKTDTLFGLLVFISNE